MRVSETFWLTVIGQLQDVSIVMCVVLFLLLPKAGKKEYMEFGLVFIVSLVTEIIALTGNLVFHKNMNLTYSIHYFLNFPLLILFYRQKVSWRGRDALAFAVITTFFAFGLFNMFFIQGIHRMNSFTRSLGCFFLIITSITYLFEYAQKIPLEDRLKEPMYWITIAILFYNVATIYLTLWVEYLITVEKSNLIGIWKIHNALGIVYYAFFSYALILIRRHQEKTIV